MSILISGILVNPAGVPVVGAEITFTALTTSESVLNGFSASIITNDKGEYAIPLEYCDYSISIQSDGHNTVYGAVSITEKSTPTTINELLKLAAMEQTITPAIIVYFREIKSDVTAKLAAVKTLNDSAKDAANSAIAARNEAAQYAQSVNLAVAQAQQASVAAGNAASIAETAAENATETLSYYQQQLVGWQQILTGSGDVTLTAPDGQTVTVRSQKAWDDALDGKVTGVKQGNSTDATVGRILALSGSNGSFGLGGNTTYITETVDLHVYFSSAKTGFYSANTAVINGISYSSHNYFWQKYNDNYGTLLAMPIGSNQNPISVKTMTNGSWSGWKRLWDTETLTRQTTRFDATGGTVMLNGAWGWGAKGLAFNRDAAATIAWLRATDTGSTIYRNDTASVPHGIRYAPSILLKAGDLWASMSFGHEPTVGVESFGIRAAVGNESGTRTVIHDFWTDQNLVKQSQYVSTSGDVLISGLAGGIGSDKSQVLPDATLASNFRVNGVWYARSSQQSDVPNSGYLQNLFGNPANTYGAQIWIDVRNSAPSFRYRTIEVNNVAAWHELATLDTAQTITGQKTFESTGATVVIKPPQSSGSAAASFVRGYKFDGSNHWYIGKGGTSYNVAWSNQHASAASSIALEEDGNVAIAIQTGKIARIIINGVTGRILSAGHNAVADSNGFWKTASPVVKLFADGTSELTSEAEGITTERLSEGVYRISGCLGLNADRAWGGDEGGIDVPMCRNKLPRLWVDYGGDDDGVQINPDGSIVIRTYHRPHPDAPTFARNEIEGYTNGDPIDIPRDTFISVRVQMPEKEAPKFAILHSNVYCGTT